MYLIIGSTLLTLGLFMASYMVISYFKPDHTDYESWCELTDTSDLPIPEDFSEEE